MVEVSVEYHIIDRKFLDEKLTEIAGKHSCSSGCFLAESPPVRDIQWKFKSKSEAIKVAKKMKELAGIESVLVDGKEINNADIV